MELFCYCIPESSYVFMEYLVFLQCSSLLELNLPEWHACPHSAKQTLQLSTFPVLNTQYLILAFILQFIVCVSTRATVQQIIEKKMFLLLYA